MIGNVLESGARVSRQVMLAVLGACALALVGCGGSESEKPSASAGSVQAVPVTQGGGTVTTALPIPSAAVAEEEGEVVPSEDSLPPEVMASSSDTLVAPGSAVEIIALGSPDVRDMTLADGIGKTQPFVYDVGTKSWRAFYRVPMSSRIERLGLSVTAKNDAHRWRRVWIFLRLEREGGSTAGEPTQP